MSIITVSRGSYSRGKEVAEKVAQRLGYECISRDVLVEASKEFNVPEIKLLRAIRHAPSFLDRFTFGKERYVAYIQAALLEHFQRDNIVYHGLAGHYFVKKVSHVLKVRIIAELEDRVKLLMRREEVFEQAASAMEGIASEDVTHPRGRGGLSREKALRILEDIDETRRKWGLYLYGIDTTDCSLYDLVIHINKLSVDDAVEMICHTVGLEAFQTTAESQQTMNNLLLAACVKASLIVRHPRVNVTANYGVVYIGLEGASSGEEKEIRDTVEQIPGVKQIDVNLYPFVTPD
ncbi:MAG: cytidylate kinase-like family protein [Planctomycetota bacterium]